MDTRSEVSPASGGSPRIARIGVCAPIEGEDGGGRGLVGGENCRRRWSYDRVLHWSGLWSSDTTKPVRSIWSKHWAFGEESPVCVGRRVLRLCGGSCGGSWLPSGSDGMLDVWARWYWGGGVGSGSRQRLRLYPVWSRGEMVGGARGRL